jgi:hypothetical protein
LRFRASTFNAKNGKICGDAIGGGFIFRRKIRPTLQTKLQIPVPVCAQRREISQVES